MASKGRTRDDGVENRILRAIVLDKEAFERYITRVLVLWAHSQPVLQLTFLTFIFLLFSTVMVLEILLSRTSAVLIFMQLSAVYVIYSN